MDWDYDAPTETWAREENAVATREECEAQYAEMARREASHKARALAYARAIEPWWSRMFGPLIADASTSVVCRAMADEWTHMRCREVPDRAAVPSIPANP